MSHEKIPQLPQEEEKKSSYNQGEFVQWKKRGAAEEKPSEGGWRIERIVGAGEKRMMEITKMKKHPQYGDIQTKEIVYEDEISKDPNFHEGETVEWKRGGKSEWEPGWEITRIVSKAGKQGEPAEIMMEIRKRRSSQGRGEIYETEIAYEKEIRKP